MLVQLKEDATNNTKSLQAFGKQLLERLSSSKGNLLDDGELIEVLANTKAKAKDVEGRVLEWRPVLKWVPHVSFPRRTRTTRSQDQNAVTWSVPRCTKL